MEEALTKWGPLGIFVMILLGAVRVLFGMLVKQMDAVFANNTRLTDAIAKMADAWEAQTARKAVVRRKDDQ